MTPKPAKIEITADGDAARTADYNDITTLAYKLWMDRGCPIGSPEEDWFGAEKELRVYANRPPQRTAYCEKAGRLSRIPIFQYVNPKLDVSVIWVRNGD